MGEVIAQFRRAACAARKQCDLIFYSPVAGTEDNLEHFDHILHAMADDAAEGHPPAVQYACEMADLRAALEADCLAECLDSSPRRSSRLKLTAPPKRLRPRHDDLREIAAEAVASAVEWGPLAASAASLIRALVAAHEQVYLGMLSRQQAIVDAQDALTLPPGDPQNFHPAIMPDIFAELEEESDSIDKRYAAAISAWFAEYLALAPFERAPPAAPGSAAVRKASSEQRRIGRPVNDEQLARDLLEGWQAYEPEEGRKRIEGYLAQRADVRALKTEQAQRNRIAFLRTAYESARSYRRVKELAKESVRRRN